MCVSSEWFLECVVVLCKRKLNWRRHWEAVMMRHLFYIYTRSCNLIGTTACFPIGFFSDRTKSYETKSAADATAAAARGKSFWYSFFLVSKVQYDKWVFNWWVCCAKRASDFGIEQTWRNVSSITTKMQKNSSHLNETYFEIQKTRNILESSYRSSCTTIYRFRFRSIGGLTDPAAEILKIST